MYSLDKLPLNTIGYIKKIYLSGNSRKRLIDLGFIKNTKIKPLYISPSGDPRAYEIRGSIISIRKASAKEIEISNTFLS